MGRSGVLDHAARSTLGSGVRERRVTFARGSTWVMLTWYEPPTRAPDAPAFVSVHSYGHEQATLEYHESGLCRRIAAAGFPAVRVEFPGYADSPGEVADDRIATRVDVLNDIAPEVLARTGAGALGIVGWLFGGAVALAAAGRITSVRTLALLGLQEPAQYVRAVLRSHAITLVAGSVGGALSDTRARLEKEGSVEIVGYPLTRGLWDEAAAFRVDDLDLGRVRRVVITHSMRTSEPDRFVGAVRDVLVSGGADVQLVSVAGGVGYHLASARRTLPRADIAAPMPMWLAGLPVADPDPAL